MGFKDIKDFTPEEIGMWLTVQGLGEEAPKFLDESVDGDLLLTLSYDELKSDLGLSSLQAKKVLKNIKFTQDLVRHKHGDDSSSSSDRETEDLKKQIDKLEGRVKRRDAEIRHLLHKIEDLKAHSSSSESEENKKAQQHKQQHAVAPAPPPSSKPKPTSPPPSSHHQGARRAGRGAPVLGGAARGAAGGAVRGAIIGAILPGMDAGDGAAAGAAAGAFSGGVGGLAARRRMRGR